MRTRSALVAVAAAAALSGVGATPAHAGDFEAPLVSFDPALHYTTGTALSDSTSSAQLSRRAVWKTYYGSGVCAQSLNVYRYRSSVGWSYLGTVGTGVTQHSVSMGPSDEYLRFSGHVDDCAGNRTQVNHYYYPYGTGVAQQGAMTFSSGWQTASCRCWSAGSSMKSVKRGATATFTANARAYALVADYAPGRGTATVYVNGVKKATVNLNSSTKAFRTVIWEGFYKSAASREIKVVTSGEVYLDAVASAS